MSTRVATAAGFVANSPSWGDTFTAAVAAIQDWHERARSRRALAELDPHLLKDIGVSRDEARAEAIKPFWVG